MLRRTLSEARAAIEKLDSPYLLGRYHTRAAWVHGHMGDRRSGLAEVDGARQIVSSLGLDNSDGLVQELDAVAHWLKTAEHEAPTP